MKCCSCEMLQLRRRAVPVRSAWGNQRRVANLWGLGVSPACCDRGPVAVRSHRTARRPGAQRVGEPAAGGKPLGLGRESSVLRPGTGRGSQPPAYGDVVELTPIFFKNGSKERGRPRNFSIETLMSRESPTA